MAARFKLEGIYTPVITPFDEAGEIDFDALAELVERLVGAGVHGLISGGSTGENYAETVEERLQIARFSGLRWPGSSTISMPRSLRGLDPMFSARALNRARLH